MNPQLEAQLTAHIITYTNPQKAKATLSNETKLRMEADLNKHLHAKKSLRPEKIADLEELFAEIDGRNYGGFVKYE